MLQISDEVAFSILRLALGGRHLHSQPATLQAATACRIHSPKVSMDVAGVIVMPAREDAIDAIEDGEPFHWIIVLDDKTGCRVATMLVPRNDCFEGMRALFHGDFQKSARRDENEKNYDYNQMTEVAPVCREK